MPAASPAAAPNKPEIIARIIDELGPLNQEIDRTLGPLKPKQARAKVLEAQLRVLTTGTEPTTHDGTAWIAIVGQPAKVTHINYVALWRLPKKFLEVVMTAGVEKLRATLTGDQAKKILSETQDGTRTVSTYPKLPK